MKDYTVGRGTENMHSKAQRPSRTRDLVCAVIGSIVAGIAMVAVEGMAAALPAVIFVGISFLAGIIFLRAIILLVRNFDPRRPVAPALTEARRRPIPPEPPPRIHEIAYNCVICGRPLTNPQSMRARVGSTCIQTYGPRFKLVPNPDHDRWRAVLASAEVDRAAEQARLKVAHHLALAHHAQRVSAWEAERRTAAGQNRRQLRRAAGHQMVLGAVVPIGAFIGIAIALAFV